MENSITLSGKMFNPQSFTTKDNIHIYSFSLGFSKINKKTEAWTNMYIPISLYDKENKYEKVMQMDKMEVTVQGVLDIKTGYTKADGTEVPAQLSIFAFEASSGKKMKPQEATQGHNTSAAGMNAPSDVQRQAYQKQEQPAPTQTAPASFPDMNDGSSIPF